ncbi:hypothetical protein A0H81_05280 [Grifola frondosa]|uniref:Uncharacterized protein n=1 Tax=Grifola frondosa TaxID=5627 RepID=A0A1C7MCN6_GRIFR|nr:hypothetical protein A0H81_05280 [Grifola frondosa]
MSNSGSLTISSPLAPSPAEAQPFPSSQQQDNLQVTKDIMEWVFAVAAAVLIVSLIVWRCTRLRRGNRPLHEFFRTQNYMDYTPGEFSGRQVSRFPPDDVRNSLTYGPILSPVPLVHRGELTNRDFVPLPLHVIHARSVSPLATATFFSSFYYFAGI